MTVDIAELATELTNDPASLGYATELTSGNNNGLVAKLNLVRDTITVDKKEIQPAEAQSAVVGSEFVSLSDVAQRAWQCIVGLPAIPVANANIRAQIAAIWGAGTSTRTNLLELQTLKGSRAEALWGEAVSVSLQNVRDARDLM